MDRHLVADAYLASVGGDLIVLDGAGDRYLCLPGAGGLCVREADGAVTGDPSVLGELEAAGLAAPRPDPRRVPSRVWPRPARDLPWPAGPIARRDVPVAAATCLHAVAGYFRRPFPRLLQAARRQPVALVEAGPTPRLVAEAQSFRRIAPFTPLPAKCLLRAFMLRGHLARAGLAAAWVFGVRTWPFGAHCWLQAGDMVLDDRWERLAVYEPILVI